MSKKNLVRLRHGIEVFGYSYSAVRAKIYAGKLVEGKHYFRDPDGRLVLDVDAFSGWIRGEVA